MANFCHALCCKVFAMANDNEKKKKNDDKDKDGFFNRLMHGKFPIKKKPKQSQKEEKSEKKSEKEKKSNKIVGFIVKPYHYIKRKINTGENADEIEHHSPGPSRKADAINGTTVQLRQSRREVKKAQEAADTTSSKKTSKKPVAKQVQRDVNVELSSKDADASSKKSRSKKVRKKTASGETESSTKKKRLRDDEISKRSTKSRKSGKKTPRESSTPTTKKSQSDKTDDEYEFIFADNIRSGLQTLKKNFISRPYQPKSMKRMLERIAKRHQRETTGKLNNAETPLPRKHEMSPFDDCMPKATATAIPTAPVTPTASSSTTTTTKTATGSSSSIKTKMVSNERTEKETRAAVMVEEDDDDFKKKYKPVLTNKTNRGHLILPNGRPFWQAISGSNENDDEEEPTDDELPMNADVIEDVYEGKIKLVPMPSDPVTLNPYAPMSELKKRDSKYFTKGIIFSNTVRSLLNLNDDLTDIEKRQNEKKDKAKISRSPTAKPTFIEPTHLSIYDRKNPSKVLRRIPIDVYRAETNGINSEE